LDKFRPRKEVIHLTSRIEELNEDIARLEDQPESGQQKWLLGMGLQASPTM
jgi:hypothetical protein